MKVETRGRTGVWVTGPSRSGTSMVAGLFAAHGVFFGDCIQANEYNPKGFFENVWMKKVFKGEVSPDKWPRDWFNELAQQGWCGCGPWGVKAGPSHRLRLLATGPSVVVVCVRPIEQIARSRGRVHWATGAPQVAARRAYEQIEEIRTVADVPIVDVHTDELVHGATSEIEKAFEILDRRLNPAVVRDWIDPEIWNRG